MPLLTFLASKVPSDSGSHKKSTTVLTLSLDRSIHCARAMDFRTMVRDLGRAQEDNLSVPRKAYASICMQLSKPTGI